MFELLQRKRAAVFFVAAAVLVFGTLSYLGLPKESNPDITVPYVQVSVVHTGSDPLSIEKNITTKLETELRGIEGVRKIQSTSAQGVSSLTLEFETSVEIEAALRKVRNQVDQADDLPADAEAPIVEEINLAEFPIMFVNLAGTDQDELELVVDRLEEQFESLPGVLEVDLYGKRDLELLVSVDPIRLEQVGIDPRAIGRRIVEESLSRSEGQLHVDGYTYLVKTEGEFRQAEPILNLKIPSEQGGFALLRDLGSVEMVEKEQSTLSWLDGEPAVSMGIKKRAGANILEIAAAVRGVLEEARPQMPASVQSVVINSDQSRQIRDMLLDLENSVLTALLSVFIVTILALGWRNTIIVSTVIPFSMLLSFLVLDLMGVTLNMIVLFSLILALGMLVDNAIVVVENIYRLRTTMPAGLAAVQGVREMALPISTSTLTTLCAFVPLLAWEGVIGEFMWYLPLTLIIVLSASLLTALVLNPVIATIFVRPARRRYSKPLLLRLYERYLNWSLAHRWRVLALAALAFGGTLGLYATYQHGMELFPDIDPANAAIKVELPQNAKRERTREVVRQVDQIVSQFPDIHSRTTTVGQGSGRVNIEFVPLLERSQSSRLTLERIREAMPEVENARIEVVERKQGPTSAYPISIELRSERFDDLEVALSRVLSTMEAEPRIAEYKDDYDKENYYLSVRPDRDRLAWHGLTTSDLSSAVGLFFERTKVTTFTDPANREYDIVVRVAEPHARMEQMLSYRIPDARGNMVALGTLADIEYALMLTNVRRQDGMRMVQVQANVTSSSNAIAVREDIRRSLEQLEFPSSVSWSFGGQSEDEAETQAFLGKAFVAALFMIFTVLLFQFESFAIPLLIGVAILFSVLGVLIGLLVMQMPFGIVMVGIGIVSLAGIVVNNAIVLFDSIQRRYRRTHNMHEAIVRSAKLRMRPVLLTAVTTLVGLLPMLFALNLDFRHMEVVVGTESSQWWQSMSTAMVFGLFVSTAMTLLILPALSYQVFRLGESLRRLLNARRKPGISRQ